MKEKVAIYCRLSEEDKNKQSITDESGSIQNQKAMLCDYAERQEWEIYGIYSDDDYAGADRNRPEFKRLLADAQERKFDIILCKTQSRFTRELELVERYIHGLFPIWGIRFVSIVDNADTANKGNKKSRQINGLVNEWYLEDMSDSIKSALDSRRKNGFHIGSFALYGYKKDPNLKGHLIIDEEAASVVREVFTLFSQGYGKTAIARILNDRKIPNPTEYKRLQGLRFKLPPSKSSTLWKYSAISSMLTNEAYIGNLVQGKYESISYKTSVNRPRPKEKWFRIEGTHEPIIDRALWERVQKKVNERAKPFKVGTIGLFAKKVRCASCGYIMRSTKSGGRSFLQCPSRHYAKGACEGAFISVDRLERMVIDELRCLNAEYLDMDELERKVQFCSDLTIRKQELQNEIATYQAKINQFSKGVRDLYLDKVKGLICEADFIELSKEFTSQKERLEAQMLECQKQISEIEIKSSVKDNTRKLIEQYVNMEHLTRETVEILIDKIMVGKRIQGTRNVPIEIHWNF
jgi:DNA invertase Pin-like site-specific DNA recombinase